MTVKVKGVPEKYCKDPKLNTYKRRSKPVTAAGLGRAVGHAAGRSGGLGTTARGTDLKVQRATNSYNLARRKFTSKNQPRDSRGKFRKVLARLRVDLGSKQLQNIVSEIRAAERADEVGDYASSQRAAGNVIKLADSIEAGAVDESTVKNLRQGAKALGEVMAYLPLPQGSEIAKVRFSDMPPATQALIDNMIERVTTKLGAEGASELVATLKSFKSGVMVMNADQLLAEFNRLLRVLM